MKSETMPAHQFTPPLAMTIPNAVRYSGLARSRLYDLLAAGEVEGKKIGRRTMILTSSLCDYVQRQPSAYPRAAA